MGVTTRGWDRSVRTRSGEMRQAHPPLSKMRNREFVVPLSIDPMEIFFESSSDCAIVGSLYCASGPDQEISKYHFGK